MNIIPMWPHLSIFSINNLPFIFFSGVDVTANQEEISDHETFQLEYDDMSKRWYIRTMQDKYFTQKPGGGIQANEIRRYDISRFTIYEHMVLLNLISPFNFDEFVTPKNAENIIFS